jgi:hypothetical protein
MAPNGPVHFIQGEIADDEFYVQVAPAWARQYQLSSWPSIEDYEWGYLQVWRQENHIHCSCRRHRAMIRSFTEHEAVALEGPFRYPDEEAFWARPDPPTDLASELDAWGSRLELSLVSVRPAYIHLLTPVCSWDEAWGGGQYPFAPTDQTRPIVDPWPSRNYFAPTFYDVAESYQRHFGAQAAGPNRRPGVSRHHTPWYLGPQRYDTH